MVVFEFWNFHGDAYEHEASNYITVEKRKCGSEINRQGVGQVDTCWQECFLYGAE